MKKIKKKDIYITVIFPAYNEESRIKPALIKTANYLDQFADYGEIITVLNGCTDNTRRVVTETYLEIARRPHKILVRIESSAPGKGAAIREGLKKARGDMILVTDVDLATPLAELPKLLAAARGNSGIAIGSRSLPGAQVKKRSLTRGIAGFIFNYLLAQPLVPGIYDTQCGFKVFTRSAAKQIAPLATIDGWAIDVELLHIARRLGISIKEIPVKWTHDNNSKVRLLRTSAEMARQVLTIGYNSIAGRYNHQPGRSPGQRSQV